MLDRTDLRVEVTNHSISIFRSDATEPIAVQNARAEHRPYIHPLIPPGGRMPVTENSPQHHPWQHGLYLGLNDVNGYGFWLEGLKPAQAATDGTFHPRILGDARTKGGFASWSVETDYRSPTGQSLLTETQNWTLADHGERFDLDLAWTLTAPIPVRFGGYDYGGLFLRMPYRAESGGTVQSSEGERGTDVEGTRARWVACQLPVSGNGEDAFVAVMDHPNNLRYPAPWRVDHQMGVSPSICKAGPWALNAGDRKIFLHRVSVFAAPVPAPNVERVWSEFSASHNNASTTGAPNEDRDHRHG